jgi:hypothetical protein
MVRPTLPFIARICFLMAAELVVPPSGVEYGFTITMCLQQKVGQFYLKELPAVPGPGVTKGFGGSYLPLME